jgi:type I restriction enzyme, R subunit
MSLYKIISSSSEETVVSEYNPNSFRATEYQSEADLEKDFIRLLKDQGYEYITIHKENDLIKNLRKQLEELNHYRFSDNEWKNFYDSVISSSNEGVVEKTLKIQDDHVQVLKCDDGSNRNIKLINKQNVHNNRLQVINQFEEMGGHHQTRYDVTVLVNGFPLVHIELKRRGAAIREAFNQIKRYQRDSFWGSCGLYEYVQLFVISNGTHTKYYSNTTRYQHIKESGDNPQRKGKKTSNSFEFTSYWADSNNKVIPDLMDFTKTFFAKHTLLNILTKYCVFTSEELLLVMRPYQIAATERIINKIEISNNYKKMGTLDAGGYVWHTTGSGKTLTSFKTAQITSKLPFVDKVLFVVDRKDLDYQTMKEYDRFEKGAANSNTSTNVLRKQLEDSNSKIIITTIQKLDRFITQNKKHPIYNQHFVLIFDECHRSQFGEMHHKITKAFKNYHLFGFTGTPIFAVNSANGKNPLLRTTEQAFGRKLHTYTIVDAINDGNVLPFRIDYVNTIKMSDHITDSQVKAIDIEKAMAAPERIKEVTSYILGHFDQKTKRHSFYAHQGKHLAGFNSIFSVSSIPVAMKYYAEFKKQLEDHQRQLNVALIYSFSINEDDPEEVVPEEGFDTDKLDQSSRDFLDMAIRDYNQAFSVNFDTSSDKFQNYYKDISMRVKNREVDLLIVVNMFLTGFDATTLNTLWVDKNLKYHGLLQAFSRTNRILNSVKTFGNIVCFRDLKDATDDAIALFGDREAGGIVLLKSYGDYYNGYEEGQKHLPGYQELITRITTEFPLGTEILGEEKKKEFVRLFGMILRLRNILSAFDDFQGNEILSERDYQDYQSVYIDIYKGGSTPGGTERENINDDLVFEVELIKQIEVNIDYILMLLAKYRDSNCDDKEILGAIDRAVSSSLELRSKKELIEGFIARVNVEGDVEDDWKRYVKEQHDVDLQAIIQSENLKAEETKRFISGSLRDGYLKTTGTDIDKILPPVSRFTGARTAKKQSVIEKLMKFFERYFGLVQS